MGWTIKIEDENGNVIKAMDREFILSDSNILYEESFRLLKYIDPYGDTTFNAFMFEDLIQDLTQLANLSKSDYDQIIQVIEYAKECQNDIHTYLKFYGD